MNNPTQQRQSLPRWGVLIIVANVLLALWSLVIAFPLISKCIETEFSVPDEFKGMVTGAFVGAVLAIVSAFGLTQAYKGRLGWTLAAVIMLAYFVLLSLLALCAPGSARASVKTFFYIEFPVRFLSWVGLIALYVKQKKARIMA